VAITLRDFQSIDFETLWRIDQKCFPPGIAYTKAELRAYVSAPGVFTVVAEEASAEEEDSSPGGGSKAASKLTFGLILGFIVAQANRSGIGHIITLDVLPEGRRNGIGSSLLEAAEKRLRKSRCNRVRLETAVDNLAAQKFYERQGYAVTKTIPGYYSNDADAFVLMKNLQ
jgi:ribosomal protein S18 acetylase RimI-like enzyme